MDLLNKIYNYWLQKIILKISAIRDKPDGIMEKEQVALNKTEIDFKCEFKNNNLQERDEKT